MPDECFERDSDQVVSLVLSGGIALGMYEAGAYAALHEHAELRPERLAGSSIGSVTAALIAGNPPERRVARLREFWEAADPLPVLSSWSDQFVTGAVRQAQNNFSVAQTLLFGRPGCFARASLSASRWARRTCRRCSMSARWPNGWRNWWISIC